MKHLLTWYLIFCLWPVDASLIEMFLLTPASMVYIYIDWLLLLFIAPILYIPLFLVDLSSDTIEGIYYFFYGIEAFFLTWVNF